MSRLSFLLAGSLLLAGCKAVGPDYHGPPAPEAPTPLRFKNAAADNARRWKIAEPKDAEDRGAWWTIFDDPDLSRLEDAATANNQNLRLAVARIAESRAQTRVAASDFYPHFGLRSAATCVSGASNNDPYQRGQLVSPKTIGGGGSGGGAAGSAGPLSLTQQPTTRTFSPVPPTGRSELGTRSLRARAPHTPRPRPRRAQAAQADFENMQAQRGRQRRAHVFQRPRARHGNCRHQPHRSTPGRTRSTSRRNGSAPV